MLAVRLLAFHQLLELKQTNVSFSGGKKERETERIEEKMFNANYVENAYCILKLMLQYVLFF